MKTADDPPAIGRCSPHHMDQHMWVSLVPRCSNCGMGILSGDAPVLGMEIRYQCFQTKITQKQIESTMKN